MKNSCVLILMILIASPFLALAEEGPQVDFILLVDTSLSMAPAMEDLKQFVAASIVGRFVQQGDWVAVLAFYGKSSIIWEGDIQTETEKASLIRSLHALEANGRFTDIGAVLDDMRQLVIKRNKPEIPKYILLLTDEVQEAPPGSDYRSDDFSVDHELLEYVRRLDRGSFQAITIGYGLGSRIENDLASLMKTLNDPPDRPERFLPGDSSIQEKEASSLGNDAATPPGSVGTTTATALGADSEAAGSEPAEIKSGTTAHTGSETGRGISPWVYLILALVMGTSVVGYILLMAQRSKKKHKPTPRSEDKDTEDPSVSKGGKQ